MSDPIQAAEAWAEAYEYFDHPANARAFTKLTNADAAKLVAEGALHIIRLLAVIRKANVEKKPTEGTPPSEEVCSLPNSCHLFRRPNEAGGYTYYTDEIGGGCEVWDTCLVDESTLLAAMVEESRRAFAAAHADDLAHDHAALQAKLDEDVTKAYVESAETKSDKERIDLAMNNQACTDILAGKVGDPWLPADNLVLDFGEPLQVKASCDNQQAIDACIKMLQAAPLAPPVFKVGDRVCYVANGCADELRGAIGRVTGTIGQAACHVVFDSRPGFAWLLDTNGLCHAPKPPLPWKSYKDISTVTFPDTTLFGAAQVGQEPAPMAFEDWVNEPIRLVTARHMLNGWHVGTDVEGYIVQIRNDGGVRTYVGLFEATTPAGDRRDVELTLSEKDFVHG